MPRIELILCKDDPTQTLSLYFNVITTAIAEKAFAAVKERVAQGSAVYEPDRVYNFPGDPRDRRWIADQLNQCIDAINAYSPGLIGHRAQPVMDQVLMNHLHHYFEMHRGPILDPPEFFRNAPAEIKKALEEFNVLIHRYEDFNRNEQFVAAGNPPTAKVVVTFDNRPRHLLDDDDYQYFSKRSVFGRWYVNYCEVGKPIWDLYQDRDEVVGEENILPLRYYSADSLIEFSPSITEEDAQSQLNQLYAWWDEHLPMMNQLGFKKGDPKNAVGDIPVADLDRSHQSIKDLTDSEVLALIGPYQKIKAVHTHG